MVNVELKFEHKRMCKSSFFHSATYDQLLQPENAPMRAAFIGAGGLLGYMMGAIRGRLDGRKWVGKQILSRSRAKGSTHLGRSL